jgi:hypothetical protein
MILQCIFNIYLYIYQLEPCVNLSQVYLKMETRIFGHSLMKVKHNFLRFRSFIQYNEIWFPSEIFE